MAGAPQIVYPLQAGNTAYTLAQALSTSQNAPTIGIATDQLAALIQALTATLVIAPQTLNWTQTIVPFAPNSNNNGFLPVNLYRKALRWMNVGPNPLTIVPGMTSVTSGQGWNYDGASVVGGSGGFDSFAGQISTQAFSGISGFGTQLVIWEGQ